MSTTTTRHPVPTPLEVHRAMHLDFEGTQTDAPSLLGVACEGEWRGVVLEPALHPLAGLGPWAADLGVGDLPTVLAALRQRAETENRRLFAWSTRELDAITVALDRSRRDRLVARSPRERHSRRQALGSPS